MRSTYIYRLMALLLALVLIAAACGDDSADEAGDVADEPDDAVDETDDSAPAETDGPSFIYITPDPIGVNEFLLLGEAGTEAAAEEHGGTFKTFESIDAGSMRENVEAAIDDEPDVIVMTTFSMQDLALEFAEANPEQSIVLVDACPEVDELPTNLSCAFFREHEGAYLLGIMAGSLTESGQVGTVAAVDIPFIHRWSDSFALGAQSVADVTDTQLFVGGDNPFADPARAKEQALSMANQGVDQIQAAASGGNGGVFEAAVEEGFLTYGVDVNECGSAPGSVVDNTLKRVDVVVQLLIGKALDGSIGQFEEFGLAEGGIGVVALTDDVATSGCVIADHPDIIEAVRAAADEIISGSLVIPDPAFG